MRRPAVSGYSGWSAIDRITLVALSVRMSMGHLPFSGQKRLAYPRPDGFERGPPVTWSSGVFHQVSRLGHACHLDGDCDKETLTMALTPLRTRISLDQIR